jgi:hypothetical protein
MAPRFGEKPGRWEYFRQPGEPSARGPRCEVALPEASRPILLPYDFNTSRVVKQVLGAALSLLVLLTLGILYSVLITHDRAAALQLLITFLVAGYFARLFFQHLTGSAGTITEDRIVIRPVELLGMRLPGPVGEFPLGRFEAVRVERVTNPIGIPLETQIGPHERVCLIGKEGVPDILIARTSDDEGRRVGRELAAALNLPYQDQISPY